MSFTISRNEALVLRSSLVPSSPLYGELGTALRSQAGSTTLSNGIKIHIQSDENVSSTNLSQQDTQREFIAVITKAIILQASLNLVTKQQSLQTCKEIHSHVQNLIKFNVMKMHESSCEVDLTHQRLIYTSQCIAELY